MEYSQKQLFEVAKKLIIFSAKKGKISTSEKNKIIPQLKGVLNQVENNSSHLSKKIKIFATEIISDIENDREINIDFIVEDNYVENYLQAESFVFAYNSLLSQSNYSKIIVNTEQQNFQDTSKITHTLKTQVKKTLANVNIQKSSRLLLVSNIFKLSPILEYYKILYSFLLEHADTKSAEHILEIISIIQDFHRKLNSESLKNIENKEIENFYMMCDIKNNKLSFLPIQVTQDESVISEYKTILAEKFPL